MAAIALDDRKAHPRDHDRRAAAGETVLVAKRGKLVTQLVPAPNLAWVAKSRCSLPSCARTSAPCPQPTVARRRRPRAYR